MRKSFIAILILAMVLSAGSAFAASQGSLSIDPGSANPGETILVAGGGFNPNVDVALSFDGSGAGSTKADQSGNIAVNFAMPAGAAPGIHTLSAQGPSSNAQPGAAVEPYSTPKLVLVGSVQVQGDASVLGEQVKPEQTAAAATGSSAGELPYTGGTILWILLVAGLALMLTSGGLRLLKKD